jgi:hypothetical protein
MLSTPLHAQDEDLIPLNNWEAPRYWQPPTEKVSSKATSQRGVDLSGPLEFIAVTPCRIADTRGGNSALGGPIQVGDTPRTYPLLSGSCGIPATARAYSLNITIVPLGTPQNAVGYLAVWPSGSPQPTVSTLNSLTAGTIANAAIVPAGTNGAIDVFVSNTTHVVIDINGYFANPPTSANVLATVHGPTTITGAKLSLTNGRATPGQVFTLTANYGITPVQGCLGCIIPLSIGIVGVTGTNSGCLYTGVPGATGAYGTGTVTITAPTAPGTYYLATSHGPFFNCSDLGGFASNTPTSQYVASFIVF